MNEGYMIWPAVCKISGRPVPRENHWPVASHWQTLSHNVVSITCTPRHEHLKIE
jgi:hypothetical protein